MNLLSVENVSKRYGEHLLFEGISFGIQKGEKKALVAKNGTGKSSLLKIIAGIESAESGQVVSRNEIKIGYLEQAPQLDPNLSILNNILKGDTPELNILRDYEEAVTHNHTEKLELLIPEMERLKLWDAEASIKSILGALNLHQTDRLAANLSGGEQKRIALAKLIFSKPDLLILDEPTNHLDLDMVEWLEEYLSGANQSVLMVTHDRYFLERVCNQIIELEDGTLYQYEGNFSYYLAKKAERKEQEQASIEKAQNLYRKELDWIRRQPKARTTKSKSRVDAFDQVETKAKKRIKEDRIDINFKAERLGNKIIELHNVSKQYGDKLLFKNVNYKFLRGENVGIAGKNGVGKTTLVKIITGEETSDTGKVVMGETVEIGHFDQRGLQADPEKRVIEVLQEIAEVVEERDGKTVDAARLLEKFLFSRKEQHKRVSVLSGGERRRLYLVSVLMQNPNFLILDEPTNDLDILTLTILEEYLKNFDGCVLLITHDRYLLDKVVDHTLIFEGEGKVKDFVGRYSDYRATRKKQAAQQKKETPKKETPSPVKEKPKAKLSYKEKLRFEQLDEEIPTLEAKKEELNATIASGSLSNQEMQKATQQLSALIEEIEEKTLVWMELADLYKG